MFLAKIIVYADAGSHFLTRAQLAFRLATIANARTIGVCCDSQSGTQSVREDESENADAGRANNRRVLEVLQDVYAEGDASFAWISRPDRDSTIEEIRDLSQLCDVVVLEPERSLALGSSKIRPSRIISETSRPCLIVPDTVKTHWSPDHVSLAWNDSLDSARAARDCLPWMQRAERVTLFCVVGSSLSDEEYESTWHIVEYLEARGVEPEVEYLPRGDDVSISDRLAHACHEHKTDVLIMGAYGDSRGYERVFGGVTQELLKNPPVPVLMVHR